MARLGAVRAARTRAALLSAGLDLLVDRPVDGIAIDELVNAAGVAKGSFFNHFPDKQSFSHAVGAVVRSEIEEWVASANSTTTCPLERLAGGMIAACCFALVYPRRTLTLTQTSRNLSLEDHPLNHQLLTDMQGVVSQGHAKIPSLGGAVLFWLGCCGGVMRHLAEQRQANCHQALETVAEMLQLALRGLGIAQATIDPIINPDVLANKLSMQPIDPGVSAAFSPGNWC